MLSKGKVTESGTHEELMKIPDGKYAEMCRLALGTGEVNKPEKGDADASERTLVDEEDGNTTLAVNTPLPLSRPASPGP